MTSSSTHALLGCIADDFTGATDLANMLVRGGMRTVQSIGVPASSGRVDADALVVALKYVALVMRVDNQGEGGTMALLSHRLKEPSCKVGTSPVGFIARYSGVSVLPNAPPTSIRSNGRFNSPSAHSTFMTLLDVARPQMIRWALPLMIQSSPIRVGLSSPVFP